MIMLSLRRGALRILSSSPAAFAYKPRTITSLSSSALTRSKPSSQLSFYQRRWASTETEEKIAEEAAPISKLQPTQEEEVENVIKTEDAEDATPVANATAAAATDATTSETAPPAEEFVAAAPAPDTGARGRQSDFSSPVAPSQEDSATRYERMAKPKETLYIGNLFFDVTEEDLKREMERFGSVTRCRLLRDSRGLSKGFGYVDFDTVEAATAAVEAMHQQLFEGRRIVVQYAAYTTAEMEAKRSSNTRFNNEVRGARNPPTKTLFIGNMSFEMTDKDLNNLFRGIRNVVDVRVAIDRRTGQPRGFAHADFTDIASAQEAMQVLAEKETYGRRLRVDYSFGSSMSPRNQGVPPRQGRNN